MNSSMGNWKHPPGKKVKNPKQAIAIGLREAGASKYETKEENERNLKRTKEKERKRSADKDGRKGNE